MNERGIVNFGCGIFVIFAGLVTLIGVSIGLAVRPLLWPVPSSTFPMNDSGIRAAVLHRVPNCDLLGPVHVDENYSLPGAVPSRLVDYVVQCNWPDAGAK